jgi:hypothetical protein
LLISKLEDLQNIDIQSALKSRKVGIIGGLSQKAIKRLKEGILMSMYMNTGISLRANLLEWCSL